MPGFNGTGPAGMGSMTGRGRGYCIRRVDELTGSSPWAGRGGGRGRRHRYYATGKPCWAGGVPGPREDGRQELDLLREQVYNLENALEQARKRIDELENKE